MRINRAYRYELKPNVKQRILLAKHAGAARFAYNWGLAFRIKRYEEERKGTNAIEQHRLLNCLKASEYAWMYEVSKCAPQEALRDLDKAFKNFFRRLKQKQKAGFPKFKKKGQHDSFRLTGTIKIEERAIQLPRLGSLRLKEDSKVQGKILSATVSRQADRWYVSVAVEQEIEDPKPLTGEAIGLDMGLYCFAVLSNEKQIFSPKPLEKKLKGLKRASKKHSRKKPGSNNYKKASLKLARHHRRIRNSRQNFLHPFSTHLAKTKSVIVIEDLDIKGMLSAQRLNRQIHDAGWGEFRRMLDYKTKWYGSKLILAPRYYPSSHLCSTCRLQVPKMPLSCREWTCQACASVHDRDINAARNLLNYYTESSSGIDACGDSSDGGTGNWSTSHGSLKQEVMSGIFVHKL